MCTAPAIMSVGGETAYGKKVTWVSPYSKNCFFILFFSDFIHMPFKIAKIGSKQFWFFSSNFMSFFLFFSWLEIFSNLTGLIDRLDSSKVHQERFKPQTASYTFTITYPIQTAKRLDGKSRKPSLSVEHAAFYSPHSWVFWVGESQTTT